MVLSFDMYRQNNNYNNTQCYNIDKMGNKNIITIRVLELKMSKSVQECIFRLLDHYGVLHSTCALAASYCVLVQVSKYGTVAAPTVVGVLLPCVSVSISWCHLRRLYH